MAHSRKIQIERWLHKMPMMISCEEFEDFILQYLEGELPVVKRAIFELHMKICRECRDYLAAYQRSIETAKAAVQQQEQRELPQIPEDLVSAILAAQKASDEKDL